MIMPTCNNPVNLDSLWYVHFTVITHMMIFRMKKKFHSWDQTSIVGIQLVMRNI